MDPLERVQLSISPKAPFDFVGTANAHGWIDLAPNAWLEDRQSMLRVERLSTGSVVLLEFQGVGTQRSPGVKITINSFGSISAKEQQEIVKISSWMLRAEEDFSPFYEVCRQRGDHWLRLTRGSGRLLRSSSLFEDVVKTICTTNIQWSGTKRMVRELVSSYGESFPGRSELKAFPTPEAIVNTPEEHFVRSVNLGYRAGYVYELARRVVFGEFELEELRWRRLPTTELKKKLLEIKGVGNYAAATLLMILGQYDELAIDTEFRDFVARRYFGGEYPSDQAAQEIYNSWGEWKYLAYWFDISESYLSE